MQRAIVGYHLDEYGDWVAELSCAHDQHVRHRPPFHLRAWVLETEGRKGRLGSPLECPLCDRAELPSGLVLTRRSPKWNESTVPVGLEQGHRIASGSWGRIIVDHGQLRFRAQTEPELDIVVEPGKGQAIPPDVEHSVSALGPVSFSIEFLSTKKYEDDSTGHDDRRSTVLKEPNVHGFNHGGETACFAHLLCPECGIVLDGAPHVRGCKHE